jgi:hypothetical protein
MFVRTTAAIAAIAALVVLGAAASAEPVAGNRSGVAGAPDAPAQPARARPGQGTVVRPPNSGPTIAEATTSFRCNYSDGTTVTYELSVNGGACSRGPKGGNCSSGGGANSAIATCSGGCGDTKGSGSCTQATTRR